jgi:hypothetical protein
VESNRRGGDAEPVQRADMCCCNTVDWQDLGRSSAWAGFHDCDPERSNELFFGNSSLDGGHGVFSGTRTIDTDLAFLSPAATIFPWLVERQTVSFDRDGFFAAGWSLPAMLELSHLPSHPCLPSCLRQILRASLTSWLSAPSFWSQRGSEPTVKCGATTPGSITFGQATISETALAEIMTAERTCS